MSSTFSAFTKYTSAALAALFLAGCATTGNSDDYLVFVDEDRVILEGHDPVAMFNGQLVEGDARYSSDYNGAVYLFSSAANKRSFDTDPVAYAPQFGGHCAMSMAMGMLEPADVRTFSIVDGRLVVQRNERARQMWSMDPEGNLVKADGNWPRVLTEKGKKG